MDEVQRWMTSISKSEYIVSFEEQGWDCMEAVKMMNENDVRRCVSKEGHVKIILSEIKKLLQANQPTFQKTINPASKSTGKFRFFICHALFATKPTLGDQ